jgi:hypothetical protein
MNHMNQSEVIKVSRRGNRSIVIILVVIMVIALYLAFSGPVLLRMNSGPMIGDSGLTIFNPFRSRAPERCAEAFLELMKAGRCEEAIATVSDGLETRETVCENEKSYPLSSWRLRTREDDSHKSSLSFWYRRDGYEAEDRLFVWVEKNGEQWRVTNYRRAY